MKRLQYPLRVYVDDNYRWKYFTRQPRIKLVFNPQIKEEKMSAQEIINW